MKTPAAWHTWQGDVLIINVHVQTRASKDGINGVLSNRLRIHTKMPPVAGKANKYLISFLAREFGIGKSKLEIIHGQRSRDKTIAIHTPKNRPDWFRELTKL